MAPKSRRQTSTGQLRSHSRSTSSTRVGPNLQLTQREPSSSRHSEKSRKNGHPHTHDHNNKHISAAVRVTSNQRIRSREHVQHSHIQPGNANGGGKPKKGFTIASQGNDDEEDEEDEWVSTESGTTSPNCQPDCQSDGELDTRLVLERLQQMRIPSEQLKESTRPYDSRPHTPVMRAEPIFPAQRSVNTSTDSNVQPQWATDEATSHLQRAFSSETMRESNSQFNLAPSPSSRQNPKSMGNKRHSRPPSMHSVNSRYDPNLRPHPLIRGNSFGTISHVPKPTPLAPLTVIPDTADSTTTSGQGIPTAEEDIPASPSSMATTSPHPELSKRRTSVSSVHSVSTLPGSSIKDASRGPHDRARLLSLNPSNSAAFSSLTHLPAVTRPPSPQTIAFFPPTNPHANIEGIHPLLPSPYMSNHMTVLARRTPLRESYDRVIRAKLSAR
ncbi:hypothetical protein AMATHDRAFT_190311 [Amanita thiersii Skay4041]|uniref:Uncharacterized protein n=1 Tax=Amanita thiersii Skay4041 TaxID=703135 RepID=A0A2A9NWA0_9AGAR|nr:hypothetical protein AMATHDRAFT_190311 [Amanita thiersii Skay4041]